MRNRLAIQYAIEGDLRFISHHDSLRLFARALARADIPQRYSQGFNPQPRISIALPRPVGVASKDELLLVELASEMPAADVLARLAEQMPRGILLLAAESLADQDRRRPAMARYAVEFDAAMHETVARRTAEFLAMGQMTVERIVPKSRTSRSINLRQYIAEIEVEPGRAAWLQTITQEGSARVGEVLEALGLSARDHTHRVRRERVWYGPSAPN